MNDPALRSEIGEAGRRRVSEELVGSIRASLLAAYRDGLGICAEGDGNSTATDQSEPGEANDQILTILRPLSERLRSVHRLSYAR